MDKRKEANLRIKSHIVHALMDLMKEKSYEEISISEITVRAGVSRVSYYRNYGSKEDILTETLEQLMDRFLKEIEAVPPHTPARRIMTVFFRTARENREFFCLLYDAGMDRQLQEGLDRLITASGHFPTLDRKRTYPACLFSGALFRLLIRWYEGGMAENDSELSNIFCQYMDALL